MRNLALLSLIDCIVVESNAQNHRSDRFVDVGRFAGGLQ